MAKEKKQEQKMIVIKSPEYKYITFTIVGEPGTQFNVHRLGKKAKEELDNTLEGQKKKATKKKEPRNYENEFVDSLYFIDSNCNEVSPPKKITKTTRFGFPASGLKKAMIFACRHAPGVAMTEVKGAFHVMGRFIEIKGKPRIDGFWRRIGGKGPGTGTPDWGIRAAFDSWTSKVTIRYEKTMITPESIANLLSLAGFAVGLGEDRPDKSGGACGMWRVA